MRIHFDQQSSQLINTNVTAKACLTHCQTGWGSNNRNVVDRGDQLAVEHRPWPLRPPINFSSSGASGIATRRFRLVNAYSLHYTI